MNAQGASVSAEFGEGGKARLEIVRGDGADWFDRDGRRFVDLGATHGVGNFGAGRPEIVEAIRRQAGQLVHLGSGYASPVRDEFLRKLLALLPARFSRVFLSNSGTEAVEAAIKIARSATGRTKVVAARRGFHGRTMGSLSATWRKELREPFEPLVPDFVHVAYNEPASLEANVDERTALLLLEPVQGEGGVHVGTAEFLKAARESADRAGALLAFDEVQTGLGRTGRNFAFERSGVVPDLLLLAKSLAGGLPVGATVTTAEVEARFRGSHHSTFGGGPLVCAAGIAALDVLVGEKLADRAERLGEWAAPRLAGLPAERVREVRGVGLMWGVELRDRTAPVLERLQQRGFLAIPAGATVVRLLPPLVIPEQDWQNGLSALEEAIRHG